MEVASGDRVVFQPGGPRHSIFEGRVTEVGPDWVRIVIGGGYHKVVPPNTIRSKKKPAPLPKE